MHARKIQSFRRGLARNINLLNILTIKRVIFYERERERDPLLNSVRFTEIHRCQPCICECGSNCRKRLELNYENRASSERFQNHDRIL